MVAEGTVDEEIYTMGERKKELNKSVLNDAASKDKDATSTISGMSCLDGFGCCVSCKTLVEGPPDLYTKPLSVTFSPRAVTPPTQGYVYQGD